MEGPIDMEYELVIDDAGSCTLTCGGDVIWVSDADDDFAEEFPDRIEFDDEEQTESVVEWLNEEGYIPPGVAVEIVSDDSAETGNFAALDDDEDNEDDEGESDENL